MLIEAKVTGLIDFPLRGGESPVWDAETAALWFVDMSAPELLRLDTGSGAVVRWTMPATIGSFGLCLGGRVLVALRGGVHFFDPASGNLTLIAHPEAGKPTLRLNDGKVSPDGRFWFGSMDESAVRQPLAALFRLNPDLTCRRMAGGLRVSNGLAWSADGKLMYHSDSTARWVHVHDYDPATGAISAARQTCTLSNEQGRPDGAAMDMEGFYWSAGVSAGRLNRIGPDGVIARSIALPMLAPSMPCFGGPDMRTMFVTSLSAERGGVRQAGTLVSLRVDVPGVAVARFG